MISASFDSLLLRLRYLEKWRELGIRPDISDCDQTDKHLLNRDRDDIRELSHLCIKVRLLMNNHLPPQTIARDKDLIVKDSSILNAGKGLFYIPKDHLDVIPSGEAVCYYSGHIHNFHSSRLIEDKSYLMLVAGEVLVDPGPLLAVKARYMNDPINEDLVNCKYVPDPALFRCVIVSTRIIKPEEELFASYGEMYWSQQKIEGTIHQI